MPVRRRAIEAATALTLIAVAGAARAAAFTKGPYLQSLGTTSVTVKVELDAPAAASLEIYPAGSAEVKAGGGSDGGKAFHVFRMEGLSPGTSYDYRVLAGGAKSELGHFTTAPSGDPPFHFVAYGDSRSDPAAHAAVVHGMLAAPADFLINTGDMVLAGKDPADWSSFFAVEGPMLRDRCVFATVGNHELSRGDPAGQVAFLRYFASADEHGDRDRLYGSFRWSNTRFFLLNAMDTWTGAERDWLRDELDRSLREPGIVHRVAVLHHGPFSSGPHGNNPALQSGEVTALMRDRQVDLVLAGHDHIYERGEGDGLKYVITGGAGAPLYERKSHAPETLAFEAVHHFVEIAVDGAQVKMVARRASGGVIESCGFTAGGPWICDGPAAATAPAPVKAAAKAGCGCALPGAPPGPSGLVTALLALLALGSRRLRRG